MGFLNDKKIMIHVKRTSFLRAIPNRAELAEKTIGAICQIFAERLSNQNSSSVDRPRRPRRRCRRHRRRRCRRHRRRCRRRHHRRRCRRRHHRRRRRRRLHNNQLLFL